MRIAAPVIALLTAGSALAVYTYTYSDTFATSTPDSVKWNANGSVSGANPGLKATGNGGAVISKQYAVSVEHEVKATLNLTANGGSINLMLRASDNAIPGPGAQGSFYTAEIQNPVVTATSCTATLLQRKYVNSVWTNLSTTTVACRPQMEVRAVMLSTGQMMVFFDNYFQQTVTDTEIASGRPGIGGYGMPVGNSVTKIEMGPIDHVAPFGVDGSTVGTSSSSNYIDLQWRGASDDANGIGVWRYYVLRGGTIIGESSSAEFTDNAVTANTAYSYSIRACDYHKNCAADTVVGTVTSASTGEVDPRQTGIRPTGAYWGGGGEQIDMRSRNLNYSIPLVKAQGRGGWGVTFALSYNSQLWRQDQGKVWKLGEDIGYGFGWRLQAGSLVPVYSGLWTLDHYIFIDSTGAEYRLNVNTGGVWTGRDSLYLSYDSGSRRLYFRDGSFWQMDARSAGFEDDMGTVYPTVMEDTNGNQILVRYDTGINAAWTNSSARITQIEDVRGNGAASFVFSYSYPVAGRPHLSGISDMIGSGQSWSMDYYTEQPLTDPFTATVVWGNTAFPNHLSNVNGTYHFEFSTLTGEMTKLNYPAGGYLRWTYRTSSFTSPSNPSGPARSVREVDYRYMNNNTGEHAYFIEAEPTTGTYIHTKARMHDVDAGDMVKVYSFNTNPAVWNIGLMFQYDEKVNGQNAQLEKLFTWTQDALGNAYISSVKTASDQNNAPATQQRTDQVVDTHGNLTSTVIYDWGNAATPLRTFTNTYVTDVNYTSRYMFNRLVSSTVSNGGTPLTLVSITYDGYAGLAVPSPIYEHDTAYYGTSFLYRGNVTTSVRPGVTTTMGYDATGAVLTMTQNGKTVSVTQDSTKNFAVPSLITANGFNTAFNWNGALNLNTQTGPNSDVVTFNYDGSARPSRTYSPYGAYTDYAYQFLTTPWTTTATTNGRWVKTTVDGFGRTIKTETGDGSGTKSVVDTEYAPCACSPMGKLKRVSQPHLIGGTVYWTTYTYDARGRTLSMVAADGASTTTYVYSVTNDTVTVTDPAGKTKTMTMDALGNLTQVVEPNPAGGTFTTSYTYDLLNRLTLVSMPRGASTQTRSWNYDSTTQRLTSLTNPENGTVSFTYNAADGTVATKTDAKSQQTQYTYDAKKRVTQITKAGDSCQTVTFGYDTNALLAGFSFNTSDRLATVSYFAKQPIGCEAVTEMYSYTPAGAVTAKRVRWTRGGQGLDLDAVYTYDTEGRVASVTYPNGGATLQNQFDTMGRLSGVRQDLIRDGQPSYIAWATGAVYGPAGELKNLSWVVQAGSNLTEDVYTNEVRTYNSRLQLTGLTTNGTFTQAAMNFTYNYSATANNGQLTSMTNNVSGETVSYAYDALKRLIGASTNTGTWGQSFAYDGFGNMLNQTVTQGSAPSLALAYDNATNRISTAGYGYDANGNMTASPAFGATYTYDASNRLVTAFSSNGTENYGYAPDNKRVYKKLASGEEQVHFYSGNQRLGIYKFQVDGGGNWSFATVSTQKYFGGRKLETMDRLGSDVRGTKYFPYGAEATVTANEKDKFATYFRDTASNLDYADQRYYSSVIGRMMTADPYQASGGAGDPGSWNRYAYVGGDPINSKDTKGLYREEVSSIDDWWGDPFDGLGSNDGSDGFRGSRRLACLSAFCISTDGSCEISGQRYAPGSPICAALLAAARPPTALKPPRVPLFFQFVGAVSAKGFDYSAQCGGTPFGAFATETFQILDQAGQRFAVEGLTVQENITNGVMTTLANGVYPGGDSKGWVPASRPQQNTNSLGQFVDTPFGGCDSTPDSFSFNQRYRVQYNGDWYPLTPELKVVMSQGLGTLAVSTQFYAFFVTR